ncbi:MULTISPECIES: hypothetical protein [Microcystis]|uniref:Uncharacterized protein n=1 Tax=Microcystis aeruginosa (strain NIES-843 / IAM M-2473) TaxID=449447 RepID=B0JXT2_MICAN|nr:MULTISPECIES: hypothetical protein [Microcystis]BAG01909.1 unknown protein [Microcystis aeruginosa NIES-843]
MAVLNINQEDDGDRTTFFGIALTAAINGHGAFPKIDRWSNRTCIRERTLQR